MELSEIIGNEDAKEVIDQDLTILSQGNSSFRCTLLEGESGVGKSAVVKAKFKEYQTKFPNIFRFEELMAHDLTEGTDTAKKVSETFDRIADEIRRDNIIKVVLIEEIEELIIDRVKVAHIRAERTAAIQKQLFDRNIKNLYLICTTNVPKIIDQVIYNRFDNVVICPALTIDQIRKVVEVHLKDILTPQQMQGFVNHMNPNYKWSGRDIEKMKKKLMDKIAVEKIRTNKEYSLTEADIVTIYTSMENSKKHKKDNYLDDEEEEQKPIGKKQKNKSNRKVLTDDEKIEKAKAILAKLEANKAKSNANPLTL